MPVAAVIPKIARDMLVNSREVRDIFEASRQARRDLERRKTRIARITASSISTGIPQAIQGGISDPTAHAGQALADLNTAEEREMEAVLLGRIQRARQLCEGVKKGVGYLASDILLDYYVNGLEWKQVAFISDVSKSTAFRLRDAAFEWIASVGEARAVLGWGIAEDG